VRKVWHYAKQVAVESVNVAWGVVGLGIAWAVLEPNTATRDVVGAAIVIVTLAWVLTVPMRVEGVDHE
jgi:hypothetical protein